MTHHAQLRVPRTIVLIGLMGAGKSFVGQRLARALDLPFVDSDSEVEKAAGCSVADIFEYYGEAAFRDAERRVMERLLDGPVQVLAAGGGAFMDETARAKIKQSALSVWLNADLDLLVSRVKTRRHQRPLIATRDPQEVLSELMETRGPVYAEADITIPVSKNSAAGTVQQVIDAIARHLDAHAPASGPANAPTKSAS